jgi:methylthioribose-1-phosphate isomerase
MGLVHIRFESDGPALELLDQRRLPVETAWVRCTDGVQVAAAIRDMVVRGAPAIGVTAAYGLALAASIGQDRATVRAALAGSRPTAVNLRWALERMDRCCAQGRDPLAEARAIHAEDVENNRTMGAHGAALLDGGVLTICNTGTLATGGHGTALGVVRSARSAGRSVHLFACETRPYDQGARLTAYECHVDRIPCTLIADSMAAALMASGRVSSVIAGADRVAANGDTANKIGTYGLAVLARHHGIPFRIAMPLSTVDWDCPDGAAIPIELRPAAELYDALPIDVWNPAFDVTPAELIDAWITEQGVWRAIPERTCGC